jgi:integrase/recombinase XerD
MPTPIPSPVTLVNTRDADPFAQAQMAAAAYLARYSGRTLETYRYDLRAFFQWCTDIGLEVLEATRAHIELWRSAMEERGLAASTIDRRLSTICGFYRFAHRRPDPIESGAIRPPAQGLPERRTWSRPGRARPVPLHGGAL